MKTSYSRHELYALGEPLGESVTRKEGNRVIYGGGGGGGQPTQTSSTVTQTNVPEYAKPYVETMLGATQRQLFQGTPTSGGGFNITGFQPYKAYGGTYDAQGNQTGYDPSKGIAGFQPLQEQAQKNIANMQTGPAAFNAQVGDYMSPYMQNVVDIQKREAGRQSAIQGTQQQAQAAQAGAFGGGRDAIMRAERERNLGQQMNDIQAQGSQAAYAQAANQYNQGFNQNLQVNQLQNTLGQQQQQLEQQKLNQAMQDYANAQQYPLMQLGTMSNMLRGLPMQASTSQMYQAQPNVLTQGIGAAGSLASLYSAYNPVARAEGGAIKGMASGGITAIPRYDVGGQVVSQLQQMDNESLSREAKTSPSPKIREMAEAILKQRQAGMNASPQMQASPMQPQDDSQYAGGGIIAFARGETVDADEAERLANQTQMYVQGAQQAAAERQAQEAAAAANIEKPVGMSTPPARPSLMKGINAALEGIASKVSRPVPASMMADTAEAPAGITSVRRSPRAAEFAAARNPASAPVMAPKGGPAPAPAPAPAEAPQGEASYTGTELSPDALKAYQDAAAKGNAGATAALQAYYKKFPQSTEAAPNSIMAAAPKNDANGMPVVDIPEFMKQERERIVGEQGKTAGSYYDQMQQEMKDRGLSNDEARQQYMKDAMAAKANLKDEAERTKYLNLAKFFASWGSTPGDTLAAGMTALKANIPDMISDIKDQRKALAEANDLIYKIGEATRQEQLGNWDKATKLKEDAAGRAEKFNERLTQYMYHVQDTVMQTQTSRANALTQAASAANVADIHGKYQIKASEITDRTRQAMQAGQLDVKQQALIEKSARDVQALAEQLERTATKPGSAYAAAVKAVQDAALVSDPESPLKKKAAEAQKIINDTKAQHERILSNAWQQTENLVKKYAGPDYVQGFNPYASSSASNHPADIKSLIDKYAVPAK